VLLSYMTGLLTSVWTNEVSFACQLFIVFNIVEVCWKCDIFRCLVVASFYSYCLLNMPTWGWDIVRDN